MVLSPPKTSSRGSTGPAPSTRDWNVGVMSTPLLPRSVLMSLTITPGRDSVTSSSVMLLYACMIGNCSRMSSFSSDSLSNSLSLSSSSSSSSSSLSMYLLRRAARCTSSSTGGST